MQYKCIHSVGSHKFSIIIKNCKITIVHNFIYNIIQFCTVIIIVGIPHREYTCTAFAFVLKYCTDGLMMALDG